MSISLDNRQPLVPTGTISSVTTSAQRFVHRTWIVVGIVTLIGLGVWLLNTAGWVFLLVFASILLAIFVHAGASWLRAYFPLSAGWALASVILSLSGLLGLGGWLLAPRIATQVDQLIVQLPQSVQHVSARVSQYEWGRQLLAVPSTALPALSSAQLGEVFSQATRVASRFLEFVSGGLIIALLGVYLAAQPQLYMHGSIRLIPISQRTSALALLGELGQVLRWWLVGKVLAMSVVGLLTGLGLWFLGMPLALTLGLIAAVLAFIPYLGPILSAVPAVLLALPDGPSQLVSVLLLYLTIQLIESYLLTPLIQQRAISLPPVLVIVAQILMGVLHGALGVALATPLLAVLVVIVKTLYVEQTLERQTITPTNDRRKTTYDSRSA